jgi:hypothetical protein
MNRFALPGSSVLLVALALVGCGSHFQMPVVPPAPLSATNVNLIFVVSDDLAYTAPGDINPVTTNLTNQGLQRTLLLGSYLKQQVQGGQNATAIFALEPMTHLQTAKNYPDIVPLETIQQFAMLNQISIPFQGSPDVTANSYPIFASYPSGPLPNNVAQPVYQCAGCQGLSFTDTDGNNLSLASGVVAKNTPGYYVFSAPWETIRALMTDLNRTKNYGLAVPSAYGGPNAIYAIALGSTGARLTTYHAGLLPQTSYPSPIALSSVARACPSSHFTINVVAGSNGTSLPANANRNETVYMIRHAEAHPSASWDDGNYIAAGQWRALLLPEALKNKIHPTQVYSVDPAIGIPGGFVEGAITSSYVRPALTAEPYAIANNLPLNLAASVPVFAQNAPGRATDASDFFFTNGTFSNQTLLVAWEHDHIPPTVQALLFSYSSTQTAPTWADDDYDTIWTIHIDAQGNLTIDNASCEGIDSSLLPTTAPQF